MIGIEIVTEIEIGTATGIETEIGIAITTVETEAGIEGGVGVMRMMIVLEVVLLVIVIAVEQQLLLPQLLCRKQVLKQV